MSLLFFLTSLVCLIMARGWGWSASGGAAPHAKPPSADLADPALRPSPSLQGLVHFFRGPLDTPLAISLIFMARVLGLVA